MTGEHTLKFTIYDNETGGSIVWESPEKTVDLGETGFYSVSIGSSQNPINATALQSDGLWIELVVDGGEPLSPRIKLRSVPFAVRAEKAESVEWSNVKSKPDTIGGISCGSGQVAVWDGSNWACQANISVDQSCASGQTVVGIDTQGEIICANDQVNTYSAGAGLNQNGSTFSLAEQSCSSGAAVGIDSSGSLICDSDVGTTYDRSCPNGEVVGGLNPDGSVVCVTDQNSGGDITGVTAGNGLQGGGTSGGVSVSVDYTQVQQRVTGSCGSSQVVTGINQDGTVNCQDVSDLDGCGSFVVPNNCPASSNMLGLPDCDEVVPGAFCEYDGGCSGNSVLDHGQNNCSGGSDVYLRVN